MNTAASIVAEASLPVDVGQALHRAASQIGDPRSMVRADEHNRAQPPVANGSTAVQRIVLIGCGALVREVRAVLGQFAVGDTIEVVAHYLPASLHNRPDRICNAIRRAFVEHVVKGDRVIVGYADCGTGGHLDMLAVELGFTRLPGSHCYEFFAGAQVFADLAEEEPGTFYLTDYLARHFEPLVMGALGIDKHPELRDVYFGNYARVVFLDQMGNPELLTAAKDAANRLSLTFVHHPTGLDPFAAAVRDLVRKDGLSEKTVSATNSPDTPDSPNTPET